MKLTQASFVEAVRDIPTDRTVTAFVSAESPTRADGYGYELEGTDAGVMATHPKKPGVSRFVPWANIRWVDVASEAAPIREHWKTRQKRQREEAAAKVDEVA